MIIHDFITDYEQLDYYTLTGLIEIAKRNSFFHRYWDMTRSEIVSKLKDCIDANLKIIVPDMDEKHLVKSLLTDFDYYDNDMNPPEKFFNPNLKKNDPEWVKKRYNTILEATKKLYANNEDFRNKAKQRSKLYYKNLKQLAQK